MKAKRILSLLLVVIMAASLAACGNSGSLGKTAGTDSKDTKKETDAGKETSTDTMDVTEGGETVAAGNSEIDFNEEPYTLHICYAVPGEAQPDLAMITEKLNEITLKEINAKVELEAVSLFSIANVYALKASSQEKMDLMVLCPGGNYLTNFANSNLLLPIEEYVDQWGSDIKEVLGDTLKVGQFKEHQYAIPQNGGIGKMASGFKLSISLCEKYNINPDEIKTIEDLEAAFAVIKENEPEVTVLMPESAGGGIIYSLLDYYDTCGSGGGILDVQDDGSLKIVNQLETEDYMNACKKVREWYEKGYISKDVLTAQDGGTDAIKAGKCFASAVASIGVAKGDDYNRCVTINETKPLVTTSDSQLILWGVGVNCERPDKAVQFLNLCCASEEITNLFKWGVEGVHYQLLENGAVDNSMGAAWQNYWWMLGDYFKGYTANTDLESAGMSSPEEFKAAESNWQEEYSPAYGFNFDPSNVKNQIAACDSITNEYQLAIACGTVDPEKELKKFSDALISAGLEDVMKEKELQLNEWYAAQ